MLVELWLAACFRRPCLVPSVARRLGSSVTAIVEVAVAVGDVRPFVAVAGLERPKLTQKETTDSCPASLVVNRFRPLCVLCSLCVLGVLVEVLRVLCIRLCRTLLFVGSFPYDALEARCCFVFSVFGVVSRVFVFRWLVQRLN